MTTSDTALHVSRLRDRLAGEALTAEDSGWDAARAAWNLAADQHPAAVVLAENAQDVSATLGFAREQGLRVAPQGPGHGATLLGALDDVVLLRTVRMTGVDIDPDARTATVGAGALWNDVVAPAAEHGLAALHGSSGTVGVAGYTLGGGTGWLARKYGFACNRVISFDVVTADGDAKTVSAESDPDLFWALRGGGGAAAVVTALEFGLIELREVYAGQLIWPLERAPEVAAAFREWTAGLPDDASAALKLLRYPPLPVVPEPLRGRQLVAVGVSYLGDEAAGSELVGPMRDVGERYLDTVATIPASGLAFVAGDPQDPIPGQGDAVQLDELPAAAVDAFVEIGGTDGELPLVSFELRQLGGALAQSSPDHGAADATDAPFVIYGVGSVMSPDASEAITASFVDIKARMAPWASAKLLLNFAECQPGTRGSFANEAADRLVRIKAAADPDGVILGNHVVD